MQRLIYPKILIVSGQIMSLAPSLAKSIMINLDLDHLKTLLPHLSKYIAIEKIELKTVESMIRRSMRLGAWRKLPEEKRAFLRAIRNFLKRGQRIASNIVIDILKKIYMEIEIHSLRGKAILIGILIRTRRSDSIDTENPEELLVEGLQYINRPIPFRTL
jgi:hypothetical protein